MGKDLTGKELGKGFSQRKDGIYCFRFTNRFGKRDCIYDKSLNALKRDSKHVLKADISNKSVAKRYTVHEWFEEWMTAYKADVKPNTKLLYRNTYKYHIHTELGNMLLTDVTSLRLRKFFNTLKESGLRASTIQTVKGVLNNMFTSALIDDFALKNPVSGIKIKKDDDMGARAMSSAEQKEFFDTCFLTEDFYEEMYWVHVLTGLRPGEIFALDMWNDIDFERKEINVNKTLVYQKFDGDESKTFRISTPKTKTSKRKVKFDERCEYYLRKQIKKKQEVAAGKYAHPIPGFENLLFVTRYNTPLNSILYNQAIRSTVSKINKARGDLPPFEVISGHSFRHTYATRCFEAGVSVKPVQAQLGHANTRVTLDTYTHLFDDAHSDDIEKLTKYSDKVMHEQTSVKTGVVKLA